MSKMDKAGFTVSGPDKLMLANQLLLKMIEIGYDGEDYLVDLAATAAKMVNRMIETLQDE